MLPGLPPGPPLYVYHFSEDPSIERFEPRLGRAIEGRPEGELLVWAIDEHHAPLYYFPRDCPRIVLWTLEDSTPADIERWLGGSSARMVAHIESAWEERLDQCRLYRYKLYASGFETIQDHGVHVSAASHVPVSVEPVDNLRGRLQRSGVELRVLDSLQPLADAEVWNSTLHFSGMRLRNALEWAATG